MGNLNETGNNWDLIIKPNRNWWDLRFGELWKYRDLVGLFIKRDFVAYYKQTILGPLWYIIQPVLTTMVFTIIFGNIAKLPTDNLPPYLFYLAGQVIWSYFATSLVSTSNVFVVNSGLFGKVYFPRLVVPISKVISSLVSFGIQFLTFLVFLIYFKLSGTEITLNWTVFLLPIYLMNMAGLGLGMGILVSSLTTKYRDLQLLVGFGVSLLMYATPVIYPASTVINPLYRKLLFLNPITSIVEAFRYGFLGEGVFSVPSLIYSMVFMVVLLLMGAAIFNQTETKFMDTV